MVGTKIVKVPKGRLNPERDNPVTTYRICGTEHQPSLRDCNSLDISPWLNRRNDALRFIDQPELCT